MKSPHHALFAHLRDTVTIADPRQRIMHAVIEAACEAVGEDLKEVVGCLVGAVVTVCAASALADKMLAICVENIEQARVDIRRRGDN